MWNEFRNFAFKGNAFDLAVGVIMGAAFNNIVTGIVDLLIMPIVGSLTGGLNFDSYFFALSGNVTALDYATAAKQGAVIGYGAFISIVINFLIVAFILFQMVKVSNRFKRQDAAAAAAAPPPHTEVLLAEIRDLLAIEAGKKK